MKKRRAPETLQGIVRKFRRREPPVFAAMRTLVGQYLHEHEEQASSLINDFEAGLNVQDRFAALVAGDSQQEALIGEYPSMSPERFRDVVETLFSGLFTKDEFITMVFKASKSSTSYELYQEYEAQTTLFFSRERELFLKVLGLLLPPGRVQELVSQGMSEDEIYNRFVKSCIAENIFSLQCLTFGDWRYHLTFYTDTQERLNRVVKGISTRMVNVTDDIVAIQEKGIDLRLEAPNGRYKEHILAGHDPARVLQLPQAHSCPLCHRPFASATALAVHRRRCS